MKHASPASSTRLQPKHTYVAPIAVILFAAPPGNSQRPTSFGNVRCGRGRGRAGAGDEGDDHDVMRVPLLKGHGHRAVGGHWQNHEAG